ncbi:hypothetical protein Clacol_006917 [Clathrus columnatus]|uniref:Uncharacterized protein n=1 Tax=Clathrus columnatus TaxID=1419009 RepID=A0AAV5AJ18_9AGAM|nr:hypothetical protein Clacol_006917 [Clathrus columnatus]
MASVSWRTTHVLLVAPAGWGHMRTCIVFACKLARVRPNSIIITIPVTGEYKSMVDEEIDRCLSAEEKNAKDRIQYATLTTVM